MLAADVAVKVRLLVAEHAGLELEAVQPTHSLQPVPRHENGLDLDSLDRVEIVMTVEDEFGLEISDEDAEAVTDVASLIALVQQGLGPRVEWPASADDTEGGAPD
jgi:acyl carrier protein